MVLIVEEGGQIGGEFRILAQERLPVGRLALIPGLQVLRDRGIDSIVRVGFQNTSRLRHRRDLLGGPKTICPRSPASPRSRASLPQKPGFSKKPGFSTPEARLLQEAGLLYPRSPASPRSRASLPQKPGFSKKPGFSTPEARLLQEAGLLYPRSPASPRSRASLPQKPGFSKKPGFSDGCLLATLGQKWSLFSCPHRAEPGHEREL